MVRYNLIPVSQNDRREKVYKWHKCWKALWEREPPTLWVGMHTCTAPVENSMKGSAGTKTRVAIWSSNPVLCSFTSVVSLSSRAHGL